ncbi:histidinol-phosphate transaminase [Corynebacterium cystitidis]|uniref:Histidinol-phosphate aminotransferase n=1 Tax=Corynebacterium cystitidis DSM 20524 TaxID=1121357 RepID=A0A1H9U6W6_9CORY|nr:histidinol-phosphate transaminase [Corynebacterium cystitidis]WJY81204.1 Putative phenylalanine aminotransferase [Corynebacterium cystitidis DSM 20524]SES05062.1 histidinol-phosphate aminotransferase [Corynebacterium cystitidis DSM 20524]SNV89449.1 aminotransferase [Corynebacterium cystitidis]
MIRPDLDTIPGYVPGKRNDTALKLSSNEVATPPLDSAAQAMAEAAAGANRYPDMGASQLKEALAEHLNVSVDQVAVGNGSSALCQQLVQITSTSESNVIFPWRSFEAYPIFAQVVGAQARAVPLLDNGKHDLDTMASLIDDHTSLIFLCNPNNPSGQVINQDEFDSFMSKVPASVMVGLDEAYFEFNRAKDTCVATEAIEQYPNVVGLRTFSKAYGLAGVRVGYAFGAAEIIAALNKVAIPFGVNAVAQAGAVASLNAADELLERTEETVRIRDQVADHVGAQHSQANFVWLPGVDAQYLAAKLASHGVLTRAFPEGLRITVTTEEETQKLIDAWDAVQGT